MSPVIAVPSGDRRDDTKSEHSPYCTLILKLDAANAPIIARLQRSDTRDVTSLLSNRRDDAKHYVVDQCRVERLTVAYSLQRLDASWMGMIWCRAPRPARPRGVRT